MRLRTTLPVGGLMVASGLLLCSAPAWAEQPEGWSAQPSPSERPRDYSQRWEPDASTEPTPPAQDNEAATTGSNTPMTPPERTTTRSASDTSAVQSATSTCSTDAGLPVPVAETVVDTAGTVQDTAEGAAGPLPADVAGTVGGALGCTPEPSPDPAPSEEPTDPPSEDPQDGQPEELAAISRGLAEAAQAEAVNAQVAFAG